MITVAFPLLAFKIIMFLLFLMFFRAMASSLDMLLGGGLAFLRILETSCLISSAAF